MCSLLSWSTSIRYVELSDLLLGEESRGEGYNPSDGRKHDRHGMM